MNLQEFVTATLVEISRGVTEAQKQVSEIGGSANPSVTSPGSDLTADGTGLVPQPVEFDVALVTTESSSAQGGGKLMISVLSAGGSGERASSREHTSRVRFAVPLVLPVDMDFGDRHQEKAQAALAARTKAALAREQAALARA